MKYQILEQEGYASTIQLNAEFKYKNKKYKVKGVYYNGDRITDIEVYNDDEFYNEINYNVKDNNNKKIIIKIGKEILYDINLEKYLTY